MEESPSFYFFCFLATFPWIGYHKPSKGQKKFKLAIATCAYLSVATQPCTNVPGYGDLVATSLCPHTYILTIPCFTFHTTALLYSYMQSWNLLCQITNNRAHLTVCNMCSYVILWSSIAASSLNGKQQSTWAQSRLHSIMYLIQCLLSSLYTDALYKA